MLWRLEKVGRHVFSCQSLLLYLMIDYFNRDIKRDPNYGKRFYNCKNDQCVWSTEVESKYGQKISCMKGLCDITTYLRL